MIVATNFLIKVAQFFGKFVKQPFVAKTVVGSICAMFRNLPYFLFQHLVTLLIMLEHWDLYEEIQNLLR